jgi:hypothetical protein
VAALLVFGTATILVECGTHDLEIGEVPNPKMNSALPSGLWSFPDAEMLLAGR